MVIAKHLRRYDLFDFMGDKELEAERFAMLFEMGNNDDQRGR